MNIIKSDLSYRLATTKNSHYTGNYQILEITEDYPNGETCGVYSNKKDALADFKKLVQKERYMNHVLAFNGVK